MQGKKVEREKIFAILNEARAGVKVADLSRKYDISESSITKWRAQYGGMKIKKINLIMQLKEGNGRMKHIVAVQTLDIQALKSIILKCSLTSKTKRELASQIIEHFGLRMRRACRLIGLAPPTFLYRPIVKPDEEIIHRRLRELAEKRKRFGCQRLHALLKREGFKISLCRTRRIYKQEGLEVRLRPKKKITASLRVAIQKPNYPNHIWCMDFIWDNLTNGQKIKIFVIIDEYTRKCFRIEANTAINGVDVVRMMTEIVQVEDPPEIIVVDNCAEFHSNVLDRWAYQRSVKLKFIRPGKIYDNIYIESFNARFRDECLNEHWFSTIRHTRKITEKWRIDYNNERPHKSLGYLTPEEFIKREKEKFTKGKPVKRHPRRRQKKQILRFAGK